MLGMIAWQVLYSKRAGPEATVLSHQFTQQHLDNNMELMNQLKATSSNHTLKKAMDKACAKIAPLWPLENFVAVNPYLGLTEQRFDEIAQRLAQVGGIQSTMPLAFYRSAFENGYIQTRDIEEALKRKPSIHTMDVETFVKDLWFREGEKSQRASVAGYADVADAVCAKDWSGFITDRISSWAGAYFDRGQAQWSTALTERDVYAAWRFEAETDRSPEVMGLKGFRQAIASLPLAPLDAAAAALQSLQISEKELDLYLHRLLVRHGGWAAYIAHLDWDARRYGKEANALAEFLCVLVSWEFGLQSSLKQPELAQAWTDARRDMLTEDTKTEADIHLWIRLVMQEAFDMAAHRRLIQKFDSHGTPDKVSAEAPIVQAVFCIDVRSELFRRNLEAVSKEVDTLGFAGFFGFPIKFLPLGYDTPEDHCPVLLPAAHTASEGLHDMSQHKAALSKRRESRQLRHAWKSFRSGAVASFGFVSPLGLSYLPKLFTDSFGLTRPVPHPDKNGFGNVHYRSRVMQLEASARGSNAVGLPLDVRIQMAKGALTAMSLTEGFARIVLIVGHGGNSVNNPHASGLDCGACAGHSGEANARVAADVLNDPEVRAALSDAHIHIPLSTLFIAALHDTTTDEVTLYSETNIPASHHAEIAKLEVLLSKAGSLARAERALRMRIDAQVDTDLAVKARSKDWSQVRPEWGLAGCSAFVAAPRSLSKGISLEGRSFLHSYEWKKDKEFKVLETIMTAPMIVASWISLQYYGSTVDNKHYGSGNKTLHNVTAGLGVLEGYAGDLRAGLPLQSIHDGDSLQHEPLRLSVLINAPVEAINGVLKKHPAVQSLCDNGWIFLMALDDSGKVRLRYRKNLEWETLSESHLAEAKTAVHANERLQVVE